VIRGDKATRVAWYAARQETAEHLDDTESSLEWLKAPALWEKR
jgi:hypothetical protein